MRVSGNGAGALAVDTSGFRFFCVFSAVAEAMADRRVFRGFKDSFPALGSPAFVSLRHAKRGED
jgi:hypothetical protein